MKDLIEEIEYKGYTIDVCYDESPNSPDEWENKDVFLVYEHRDFCVKRKGYEPRDIFDSLNEKKAFYDGYFAFVCFAYIHSGVSLSLGRNKYPFNDRWDVSSTGYVLVKRQKGWTWTREKAYKIAESIVREWNMYLSGDVYGYSSDIGGCWGFYGEEGREQMIDEAKAEIDHYIESLISETI